MASEETKSLIVFFDGVCGLCNGFVDFVIRQDTKRVFYFSPLQGDHAKKYLTPDQRAKLTTVILYDAGELSFQSDAVLKILKKMGGAWKLTSALKVFPKSFRNWIYGLIAGKRYQWFGKSESCRLPSSAERARFLD